MKKGIFFVVFFLNGVLFAQHEYPFFSFSDAILSIQRQEIYGKMEGKSDFLFPVLSYNAPKYVKNRYPIPRRSVHQIDGDILLIVDDSVGMVSHYFHFMEHLIGIWNFLIANEDDPEHIKYILMAFEHATEEDPYKWIGLSNETTRILLTSLFPNAKIKVLKELSSDVDLKAKKIHVSSRLRAHGIPDSGYQNMNGSARFAYNPHKLRKMRDCLFKKLNIHSRPREDTLRITYCQRTKGRILESKMEERLLDAINQEVHCQLNVVDFGNISFQEQLSIIANTDLFIGIHGNGLTHLLFLPDHAVVLEYYEGGESAFFRLFAQVRGIKYFGNSHTRWITESYTSLENRPPFQHNVTKVDLETTIRLIRMLQK